MIFSGEGGERFQEQQRARSGGETARDHSVGAFVIHFQIFFQCIADKGELTRGSIWKDVSDDSFVYLGEELFGGIHDAGCFEVRKELCTEGVDMWTKGKSSVKGRKELEWKKSFS